MKPHEGHWVASEEEIRAIEDELGQPHPPDVEPVLRRVFYGPSDWLIRRTCARDRQAINAWLLIAWLGPGTAVWITLRSSLAFVGLMSLYAIWVSHWGGLSAETPVEHENE